MQLGSNRTDPHCYTITVFLNVQNVQNVQQYTLITIITYYNEINNGVLGNINLFIHNKP